MGVLEETWATSAETRGPPLRAGASEGVYLSGSPGSRGGAPEARALEESPDTVEQGAG